VTVEIPDRLVRAVDHAALPSNWRSYPGPEALKDIGTEWIQKRSSAVLKVPSAAIPEEHNLVLNVDHIDFGRIKVGPPSSFIFARHS
jgi:RES domain-containing protein